MENSSSILDLSSLGKLYKRFDAAYKRALPRHVALPRLPFKTAAGGLYRTQFAVRTVFIAVAASYLITAGFSLYDRSLALPFGWHLPSHSSAAVVATDDEDNNTTKRQPDTSWTYDFSKYPDGPVSRKDWNFEIGTKVSDYNNELQSYTPRTKNIRVQDGMLVIEAFKEQNRGREYTSARINTLGKFDFTYGTIEADIQMPAGTGTWPAVWMLPSQNIYKPENYGIAKNDPNVWALNGEIDFAESVGFHPGQNIPAAHTYNGVHRAPVVTPVSVPGQTTTFHKYGVTKTPDKLIFTLDGVPYATRERTSDSPLDWPYNQPYYLIINLAIGGNWAGSRGIDDSSAPWQLKVRSISYKPL